MKEESNVVYRLQIPGNKLYIDICTKEQGLSEISGVPTLLRSCPPDHTSLDLCHSSPSLSFYHASMP